MTLRTGIFMRNISKVPKRSHALAFAIVAEDSPDTGSLLRRDKGLQRYASVDLIRGCGVASHN
jgi:hypothetical protein